MNGRDRLTTGLENTLAAPTVTEVAVDMTGLRFIDSTGLGALARAKRRSLELHKDLHVEGAHDQVRLAIDVVGLSEYLGLADGKNP